MVIDVTYDKVFKKNKSKYTTLTYLFIPDTLNINDKTYPASKFYNDVRLFLKYDTPGYSLEDMYKGESTLLKNLSRYSEKFIKEKNNKKFSLFKDQVKMFAATFSSLIREKTDSLIRKETSSNSIQDFLEIIQAILLEYRTILSDISSSQVQEQRNIVIYADEHMSNVVEQQLMKLYNHLKKKESDEKIQLAVVSLINSEQKYKKQIDYYSPKDKNIKPEELLYKRNQLKKYIENVFFLNQNIRKDGTWIEQSMLALAAGMAMVFATSIAFYYKQMYGDVTMRFFIALVISYMLKDRVKGLVSLLFISKSNSLFYDYRIKVVDSISKKVGVIKENFAFVPKRKLGPRIKKHRLKDLVVKMSIESISEQVLQYKKKITIYHKRFGNNLPDENIVGLTDVTRLNFHRFLQYMDDPKQDYILVKKGEVFNKAADKMYHINIIQKYYTEDGVEFSRYRVIMNRNGIRRIEKIALED